MAKLIADELGGDLDMILVKKIGHPLHPEFALGSVTEDGEVLLGIGAKKYGLSEPMLAEYALEQIDYLNKKRQIFSGGKPAIDRRDRIIIIVDDGIATGATMSAAIESLKAKSPKKIIVASPVASAEAVGLLEGLGAEVRTVMVPEFFGAVGYYYENFTQVSDAEVGAFFHVKATEVNIERENMQLKGVIGLPEAARSVVIFAHGTDSSRLSPRNQMVAATLNRHGIATILADLLTETESCQRSRVFNIDLLSHRLIEITHWACEQASFRGFKIGYFGASTGAGAAFVASAKLGSKIHAIVSRGGRPDLAAPYLSHVRSPTLLIVGKTDTNVVSVNESALKLLRCEKKISLISGASHLFAEPGALEAVADLSVSWFRKHFHEGGVHAVV
jgi:predicted phosphoribosyltransferase/dienelactone hydrolase